MTIVQLKQEHTQSVREEIANCVSHGIAFLLAVAATPILIIGAAQRGDTIEVVGVSIFAASMLILYLSSTLYHSLPYNKAKKIFQILDHSAIFLLIAGTYTPFTLGVLRGGWGWTLFGLVWGFALLGIVLKAVGGVRFPILSTIIYINMGWLVLIAIKPMWELMPAWGLFWLLLGGIAYTAGVAFFASERLRYSHFIWHLFVMTGTACHYIAVLRYSAYGITSPP